MKTFLSISTVPQKESKICIKKAWGSESLPEYSKLKIKEREVSVWTYGVNMSHSSNTTIKIHFNKESV